MAKKTLTDAERAQRRELERQLLTDAVCQLQSSEGWQGWLRVRRAFRTYSVNNQLLIALQNPQATRVAGFQAWIKLGYCVRKGERAIRIFAPVPPNAKALQAWREAGADPQQRPRTHFKLTAVFDRSQVDALPAPAVPVDLDATATLPEPVSGEQLAELLKPTGALAGLAAQLDVTLTRQPRPAGMQADGWYRPRDRTICVYTDRPANDQVATVIHELAHALVDIEHREQAASLDYAAEELIVESVAYSVCLMLGVDTQAATVPYLASWAQAAPIEILQQHAKLIDQIAGRIEDHLLPGQDASGDTPRGAAAAAAA